VNEGSDEGIFAECEGEGDGGGEEREGPEDCVGGHAAVGFLEDVWVVVE
jgi:hypothetical protein